LVSETKPTAVVWAGGLAAEKSADADEVGNCQGEEPKDGRYEVGREFAAVTVLIKKPKSGAADAERIPDCVGLKHRGAPPRLGMGTRIELPSAAFSGVILTPRCPHVFFLLGLKE
jgi:hypothetical protein